MTHVRVLIPWRDTGCLYRRRALTLVDDHWRMTAPPAWQVTIAVHPDGGPWVKARALEQHLIGSAGGVTIVADADVVVWGFDQLEQTVEMAADGTVAWGMPHGLVRRLSADATSVLLDTGANPLLLETAERPYEGVPGGGVVVVRDEVLHDVPLDQRFQGWGGEDQAWAIALRCLAGAPHRGDAQLIHLWHPPQPRRSRKRGSVESQRLYRRYLDCRRDPEAMRELLNGAT